MNEKIKKIITAVGAVLSFVISFIIAIFFSTNAFKRKKDCTDIDGSTTDATGLTAIKNAVDRSTKRGEAVKQRLERSEKRSQSVDERLTGAIEGIDRSEETLRRKLEKTEIED